MKNFKSFYALVIVIGIFLIFSTVNYYSNRKNSAENLPSYKESKKTEFEEHLDSTTQIYSNFRYGFSMDFPDNWQLDKGVSEHTIIRGGLKDSAYSFSINVVQLSGDFPKDFSVWELYEMDKDKYAFDMNNALQAQLNSKTFNFSQEKVYVSDQKSIETKFNYITREVNLEIEMVGVMYSVFVPPFAFTIGMHLPLEYYQNNPIYFKYLINDFGFIQRNS